MTVSPTASTTAVELVREVEHRWAQPAGVGRHGTAGGLPKADSRAGGCSMSVIAPPTTAHGPQAKRRQLQWRTDHPAASRAEPAAKVSSSTVASKQGRPPPAAATAGIAGAGRSRVNG